MNSLSCRPNHARTLLLTILITLAAPVSAQISRVSVAADGAQANADSYQAAVSADGAVVAFRSTADNLVAGDVNELPDVFVRDIDGNTVERANVAADGSVLVSGFYRGAYWPRLSADGNRVIFNSYGAFAQVFLRDRQANTTAEILPISFTSNNEDRAARQEPDFSGNGLYVVFSSARNFQSSEPPEARPKGDDNNSVDDIYWYDAETLPVPQAERLSRPDFIAAAACVNDAGLDCPEGNADSFSASISDDGNRVAFYSFAANLVAEDDNDFEDVFVKFRQDAGGSTVGIAGPVIRVSVSSIGLQGDDASKDPALSGNGQFVAFRSMATNLVAGDGNDRWDIFVHDLSSATTSRVSVSAAGVEANHDSFSPSISDDGRFVAFRSNASNLVPGDGNQRHDIFVHDRNSGQTARVSVPDAGGDADGHSYEPQISADGSWIVFESDATNLVSGDDNRARDIFRAANPLAGQ